MNWISVKDRLPLSGAIVLGTSYTIATNLCGLHVVMYVNDDLSILWGL
jgi:hypothetical protein